MTVKWAAYCLVIKLPGYALTASFIVPKFYWNVLSFVPRWAFVKMCSVAVDIQVSSASQSDEWDEFVQHRLQLGFRTMLRWCVRNSSRFPAASVSTVGPLFVPLRRLVNAGTVFEWGASATVKVTEVSTYVIKQIVDLPQTWNSEKYPEVNMTTTEIVKHHGYPAEKIPVVTDDGYVLELHRVPKPSFDKLPVLLQHGILAASSNFVFNEPEHSLALRLSDAGYDVFMSNSRGNEYSRAHTSLDPDQDEEFWDFSWEDMAIYDLPKVIDTILEVTGKNQLIYIGHSQGATILFTLLAMRPEYNEKIRLFVALAPAVILNTMKSFLREVAEADKFGVKMVDFLKRKELTASTLRQYISKLARNAVGCYALRSIVGTAIGLNDDNMSCSRLPIYCRHLFNGTSSKQLYHFTQIVRAARFQRFDFGTSENKKVYGSSRPPEYDLSKVTVPVEIWYGNADKIVDPLGIRELARRLSNAKTFRVEQNCGHMDVIWGKPGQLYQNIVESLAKCDEEEEFFLPRLFAETSFGNSSESSSNGSDSEDSTDSCFDKESSSSEASTVETSEFTLSSADSSFDDNDRESIGTETSEIS